jgi:ligand-binding sensor domain-containing protein
MKVRQCLLIVVMVLCSTGLAGYSSLPDSPLPGTITNYFDGNDVQDLAFDQQGYLWAATTNGVVRWDTKKKTYTRYTENDGLPSNNATAIAAARDGSIWVGGKGYIARLKCGKWAEYKIPELVSGEHGDEISVKDILENKKGEMWFATYGAGAIRIKGASIDVYLLKDGVGSVALVSVNEDIDGNMWFVQYHPYGWVDPISSKNWQKGDIWESGISKFDGQKWSVEFGEYRDNLVFGTYKGEIWVNPEYTHDLILHSFNTVTNFSYYPLLITTSRSMFIDHLGHIWLIQRGDVVLEFDRTEWQEFYERGGVLDGFLRTAAEDRQGNLYIATDRGIATYNGKSWGSLITGENLPGYLLPNIEDIAFDEAGKLWIYTKYDRIHETSTGWKAYSSDYGNSYYKEKKKKLEKLFPRIDATNYYRVSISADGDEVLAKEHLEHPNCIASSYCGFSIDCSGSSGVDFTILHQGNGLETISLPTLSYTNIINMKAILLASDNSLWVGTQDGVFVYRNNAWDLISMDDGLPGNNVILMDQAPDGSIWFVTHEGVSKYVEK